MYRTWGGFVSIFYQAIPRAAEEGRIDWNYYHFDSAMEVSEEKAIENAKKYANEYWIVLIYSESARKLKRDKIWGVVSDGYIGYVDTEKNFVRFRKPLKFWDAIKEVYKLEGMSKELQELEKEYWEG